jgi:tetratricopeptide (TPR) repeat protein
MEESAELAICESGTPMTSNNELQYVKHLHDVLMELGWVNVEPSGYLSLWPDLLMTSPAGRLLALEWKTGQGLLHFDAVATIAELTQELEDVWKPKAGAIGLLITSQTLTDRLRVATASFPIVVITYDSQEPVDDVCERVRSLCQAIDGHTEDADQLIEPDSSLWRWIASGSSLLLGNAATIAEDRGELEKARSLYEQVIANQIDALGSNHANTLATQISLAHVIQMTGDFEGALRMYREVLEKQKQILGPDHANCLRTRAYIASLIAERGDAMQARDEFASILADRLRVLGPDHPDTLRTRGNLADSTGQAGDVVSARDQLATLLPDRIRVLGADHPDTLRTRNNLAYWTGKAGDAPGARDQLILLLADCQRVLGPEHPDTLRTRGSLANWTGRAGDVQAARDQLVTLLADCQRVLGPEHPDTLHARTLLEDWTGQIDSRERDNDT